MAKKPGFGDEDKTVTIAIRVSPYDKELIDRACAKEGVTLTQYIHGCIYMDMLTSGDAEMMKRAISKMGNTIKNMMRDSFLGKRILDDEVDPQSK